MQPYLYERAAQVLNHEILAYEYVVKRLEDKKDWPDFKDWKEDAEIYLETAHKHVEAIRSHFGHGSHAQSNWQELLAYVEYISRGGESDTPGRNMPVARRGYNLAKRRFKSSDLVEDVEQHIKYESTSESPNARRRMCICPQLNCTGSRLCAYFGGTCLCVCWYWHMYMYAYGA